MGTKSLTKINFAQAQVKLIYAENYFKLIQPLYLPDLMIFDSS